MLRDKTSWRQFAALGVFSLLGACTQPEDHMARSNPPPVSPGPAAAWYHVAFDTGSFAIGPNGDQVVTQVRAYLEQNPGSVATIIGRTDTVGSNDYNMHLSHRRADAVRDALVYDGHVAADRVETRWTGENRQDRTTAKDVPEAANRVVDIAIH
jgi:outer membrane protein OmpA-like peptidoglycan-associated protein